jgi:hypothetical protein
MNSRLNFAIIEDRDDDRREVLNRLADAGFEAEWKLGQAATYVEGLALVEEKAEELNVVFLDLNLPRDGRDGMPEKRHGRAILDIIHKTLNQRPNVDIRVVVVSAESLDDGMQKEMMLELYGGTLVGVVQKAELDRMLRASLKRLRRDPLRQIVRRVIPDILGLYETLTDPASPVGERLRAARAIGIRLAQNERDYADRAVGSSSSFSDDLSGLVHDLKNRFRPDARGNRRVKASEIATAGGWATFVWRGWFIEHLYALNNYRNAFEHLREQPFGVPAPGVDEWEVPPDLAQRLCNGGALGGIAELMVRELLEWYLPWHEQVYLPWTQPSPTPSEGSEQ